MKKVGIGSGLSSLSGLSGLSVGGGVGGWTPASPDDDGNTPHTGFAPWLLTGIYQDSAETTAAASDGDPVGAMNNTEMFGTDAYSVTQGTTANKPTLRTGVNGLDNQPVLEFDGGDWLRGAFAAGSSIGQPHTLILVGQLDATVINNDILVYFCDSDDSGDRMIFGQNVAASPNEFGCYSGSWLTAGATNSNWNIHLIQYNGVSSQIYQNGISGATGNAGGDTPDGLTIGADRQSDYNLTGKIAALFLIDALASDAVLNQYGAYLQSIFPSLSYTEIT